MFLPKQPNFRSLWQLVTNLEQVLTSSENIFGTKFPNMSVVTKPQASKQARKHATRG
jgi:hypothetical protein